MTLDIISLFRQSRAGVLARLPALGQRPSFRITRIDDPDGSCAIVAGQGTVDAAALRSLWDVVEGLDGTTSVHIDLHNATIPAGPWMAELAAIGDALEAAGLRVRIVGIDPSHPDLYPRSPEQHTPRP